MLVTNHLFSCLHQCLPHYFFLAQWPTTLISMYFLSKIFFLSFLLLDYGTCGYVLFNSVDFHLCHTSTSQFVSLTWKSLFITLNISMPYVPFNSTGKLHFTWEGFSVFKIWSKFQINCNLKVSFTCYSNHFTWHKYGKSALLFANFEIQGVGYI